jgi:hypothetical protein
VGQLCQVLKIYIGNVCRGFGDIEWGRGVDKVLRGRPEVLGSCWGNDSIDGTSGLGLEVANGGRPGELLPRSRLSLLIPSLSGRALNQIRC